MTQLAIATQEALTDAGFAPTAGPDFLPTGAFVLDYTDSRGDARRIEVTAAEDVEGAVRVGLYWEGKLTGHPRVQHLGDVLHAAARAAVYGK
jgi:hypothetical protein